MFSKKTLPIWRGLTAVFVALFALVIIGTGIADAMFIVGRSDDDKEKPQDIVDKD